MLQIPEFITRILLQKMLQDCAVWILQILITLLNPKSKTNQGYSPVPHKNHDFLNFSGNIWLFAGQYAKYRVDSLRFRNSSPDSPHHAAELGSSKTEVLQQTNCKERQIASQQAKKIAIRPWTPQFFLSAAPGLWRPLAVAPSAEEPEGVGPMWMGKNATNWGYRLPISPRNWRENTGVTTVGYWKKAPWSMYPSIGWRYHQAATLGKFHWPKNGSGTITNKGIFWIYINPWNISILWRSVKSKQLYDDIYHILST